MREYPLPDLPPLLRLRRTFARPRVVDLPGELLGELSRSGVTLKPGGRYAIGVGSRGIANLALLVRTLVNWVKEQGGRPFLVPAMGSHGGATGEGQRQVIESYGITESAMGCPIVSSMDVVELPREGLELPTYFSKDALSADGTILINRVKVHTDYHATYESGLMKMTVIGLGKHRQALAVHGKQTRGMIELLPQVARNALRHGNIILGVALVENAYEETALIRAIPASRIPDEEPALLEISRRNMPSLPIEEMDVLVIDEIGKNISGLCMDSNVTGRMGCYDFADPPSPRIRIVIARDLTDASHGNAIGLGLADVTTRRLYDKIDCDVTYENVITNTFLDRGKLPIVAATDRQAMAIAWRAAGSPPPEDLRLIRIVNTLHLTELLATEAVAREVAGQSGIEVLGPAGEWFNGDDLSPFGI